MSRTNRNLRNNARNSVRRDGSLSLEQTVQYASPAELGQTLIGLRKIEQDDATGVVAMLANLVSGALRRQVGI